MGGTRIELTASDGTAVVTLDGPDTRNAIDAPAAAELIAICDEIDRNASIGAAIITGAGEAFCSGADTRAIDSLRTASADAMYEGLDELYGAFRRVGRLAVPTIAAVNGPAVGAGLNLALSTDLRLVSPNAVLVSGFARIGLHPGGGHLHLLARTGGPASASAAGVFARRITAEQAVAAGIAWAVVPEDELLATAGEFVAHLAAVPSLARALVGTLRHTVTDTAAWDRAVEIERARQMWSLSRPGKEG